MNNREIKFRAWFPKEHWYAKANGQMIYDYCDKIIFENCGFFEDDIVFMQYTGLKDKNGVEIYEGDIVTFKRPVGNWTGKSITTTHEIIFSNEIHAFVLKYNNGYIKLRRQAFYEYEVIGNIYEHPHLLLDN